MDMNLREQLISQDKTKWLDIGCGGSGDAAIEAGFEIADVIPVEQMPPHLREHYRTLNLLDEATIQQDQLEQYDLIRMQHVFEHLTFEEGKVALEACAKLLTSGGTLLMTTPDLRVHIKRYQDDSYREWSGFAAWAHNRIPEDAPDSAYFSVFAHSMIFEQHKWCYDDEGLLYQLNRVSAFTDSRVLTLDDPLSEVPFTHNRPEEDVCVIARKQ